MRNFKIMEYSRGVMPNHIEGKFAATYAKYVYIWRTYEMGRHD